MSRRSYFSARTGKNPSADRIDFTTLRRLFLSEYRQFVEDGWFQQAFGYRCIDEGDVAGTLGRDVEARMLLAIRKDYLWPIEENIGAYSEDDLFDVIEFLHDHISLPLEGDFHSYGNCGMHYREFDPVEGRERFRERMNALLSEYGPGYELTVEGEIVTRPEEGMQALLDAPIPASADEKNVRARVREAVHKFRRRGSSAPERRDALRDLANVLEYLRPQVKQVLTSKDEADLFTIANNFGIRHHNSAQKTNYDQGIWYSWLFYYYLATIHAALRLLERQKLG